MELEKKRLVWIDLARITATFGVILKHHVKFQLYGSRFWEFMFWAGLFTFVVPLFLLLSGTLILQKQPKIKRIFTHNIPVAVLMIVTSFGLCLVGVLFREIFNGHFDISNINYYIKLAHSWEYGIGFVWQLLGLYLISPFLYVVVQDAKLEKYFLALSCTLSILMPALIQCEKYFPFFQGVYKYIHMIDNSSIYLPVGSSIYFIFGHFLYSQKDKISKKTACALLIAAIFATEFFCWIINSHRISGNIYANFLIDFFNFGRYYAISFVTIFNSVSVYLFFMVVVSDFSFSERVSKIINRVGKNSVFVFLIHGIAIEYISPHLPKAWAPFQTICIFVECTMYFILCFLVSLLLEKIPLIKRISR